MTRPSARRVAHALAVAVTALTAVIVASCADHASAPILSPDVGPRAAAASGGVSVSSTRPDTGVQSTTMDVKVVGSGFEPGMAATWALRGVADPEQIRTNSTSYVSSRELRANITISGTATLAKWDVQVMGSGKGGIGTELFEVKVNGNIDLDSRAHLLWSDAVNVAAPGEPELMRPAGIRGDDRNVYGGSATSSEYQGEFCHVHAKIWWYETSTSQSGDLVFHPGARQAQGKYCGSSRALRFYLNYRPGGDPGSAKYIAAFTNARQVMQLADGESRSQWLRFMLNLKGCKRVEFNTAYGVANARVERLPDIGTSPAGNPIRRWRVSSEYPHTAMCMIESRGELVPTGTTKYLPFSYVATEVPYQYPKYPD